MPATVAIINTKTKASFLIVISLTFIGNPIISVFPNQLYVKCINNQYNRYAMYFKIDPQNPGYRIDMTTVKEYNQVHPHYAKGFQSPGFVSYDKKKGTSPALI